MTKGELPLISAESEIPDVTSHLASTEPNAQIISNGIEIPNKDGIWSDNINGNIYEKDNSLEYCMNKTEHEDTVRVLPENNNNNEQIDMVEYVNSLHSDTAKKTIHRILSIGDVDENDMDIENIEHYLIIAKLINSSSVMKVCENKLISNLNLDNCEAYYETARKYCLKQLQTETERMKATKTSQNSCPRQNATAPYAPPNGNLSIHTCQKRFKSYEAIFTCGMSGSKRTVTTAVYNNEMTLKSYKDLQRGDKISKQFKCCCVQDDEENDPLVFWCFGKSVYRYDPILNKCKEKASLICKRSHFCMVSHSTHCYVIGRAYQSHKVLEIEDYLCTKKGNSWKKVAYLPRECLPINSSCVVFNDLIYIFCAIVDDENNIKSDVTGVYVFNPGTKTVKSLAEIPLSFCQMKTCCVGSFIYIASDKGHFIRFSPLDGSYIICADQMFNCRDFGMFVMEENIVLVGGQDASSKCCDVIRSFCTHSGIWTKHRHTLPDSMAICGVCEIKIPISAGSVVPFYETNIFEK